MSESESVIILSDDDSESARDMLPENGPHSARSEDEASEELSSEYSSVDEEEGDLMSGDVGMQGVRSDDSEGFEDVLLEGSEAGNVALDSFDHNEHYNADAFYAGAGGGDDGGAYDDAGILPIDEGVEEGVEEAAAETQQRDELFENDALPHASPQQQIQQQLRIPLDPIEPLQSLPPPSAPQTNPPISSESDANIHRILAILRLPTLERDLSQVAAQMPAFAVFLDRLDKVLSGCDDNESAQKGKAVLTLEDQELALVRKKADLGKRRLEMDLEFEERAHVFESETRKLRDQLKTASLRASAAGNADQENIGQSGSSTETTIHRLQASLEKSSKETAQLKSTIQSLESDKRNLSLVVNGKLQETDSYYREMEHLRKSLDTLRTETLTLQTTLHTTQTSESKHKQQHAHVTQQLELATQNATWLHAELARKTDEYRAYRVQKTQQVEELQRAVEEAEGKWRSCDARVRKLEERCEGGEKRVFELLGQVQEEKEKNLTASQSFKSEMTTQTRLLAHAEQQYTDLSIQFDEYQTLVRDTKHAFDQLVVDKAAAMDRVVALETENQALGVKVGELEGQVEAVNKVVGESVNGNDMSIVSPAAQAASALQRSGKTFTQIYLEYIRLNDDNIGLKSDLERMNENLNSVLNDINERAPMIKQTAEDKQQLEQEVAHLMQRASQAEDARDEAIAESTEAREQMDALVLKNKSLDQESHDLGRQVQHLLLELERIKTGTTTSTFRASGGVGGGIRSPHVQLRNTDPSVSTTSGRVISDRLVLFDNITELQAQNQQLRSSLRSVSEALAKIERGVQDAVEDKVARELEETVQVLGALREQVRVANERCDSLARERDELRWELENGGDGANGASSVMSRFAPGLSFSSSMGSRPGTPAGGRFAGDSGAAVAAIQSEFDEYRRSATTDIQRLRELNETLSAVKANLDVQVARLQNTVDNSNERQRTLLDQLESSKLECRQLQTQLTTHLHQHTTTESRLQQTTAQLTDTQAALASHNNELRLLRADREALVVREVKLAAENEALVQQVAGAKEQLGRVQRLYEETSAFGKESAAKAEEKVQGLDGQLGLLRAQLSAAQDDSRARSLRYETNISDARYQIERLNAELSEAVRLREVSKAEERRLTQHSQDLTLRLTNAEKKVDQLQVSINDLLTTPESIQLREARGEISELKMELETTQSSLDAQKANVEQYKAIAESAENKLHERLEEFNATYDRFKNEMEQRVATLQAEKSALELSKKAVENNLAQLASNFAAEREVKEKETKSLEAVHAAMQDKITQLETAGKLADSTIKSLKEEVDSLQKRLVESREAYERVVRAEAERIRALDALKREIKDTREEVMQYKEQALFVEGELDNSKTLWEASKSKLEEELEAVKKTNEDLTVQNKILHNQFESVSARMTAVSSLEAEGGSSSQTLVGSQEDQERLELIRHLRRDKDNLSKELEVSKQNLERQSKQVEQLQVLLNESRANLETERKSQKTAGELETLHKELLSKIDRVNVLTESNATLRHHNNVITRKVTALEAKLKACEDENGPLREQNSTYLAEVDALKGQVHTLESENAKLMGRANEILGKYNRVDPAEHQSLKDQITELTDKLAKSEAEAKQATDKLADMSRTSEGRAAAVKSELEALRASLQASKTEVAKLKDDLAETSKSSDLVPLLRTEIEALRERVKNKVTEANKMIVTKNTKISELNEEKRVLEESNSVLTKLSETFETQKLEWQVTNQVLEKINADLSLKMEGLEEASAKAVAASASQPILAQKKPVQLQPTPQQPAAIPPSPSPSSKRPREEDVTLSMMPPPAISAASSQSAMPMEDESVAKKLRVGGSAAASPNVGDSGPSAPAAAAPAPSIPAQPVKIQRIPVTVTPMASFSSPAAQGLTHALPSTPAPVVADTTAAATTAASDVTRKTNLNALLQKKMANLKKEDSSSAPSSPAFSGSTSLAVATPEPIPVAAVVSTAQAVPAAAAAGTPTPAVSVFGGASAFPGTTLLGKGTVRIRPPGEHTHAVVSPISAPVRPSRGRPLQPYQARPPIQQIQYHQGAQTPGAVRPLRRPSRGGGSVGNSPAGHLQHGRGGLGRGQPKQG
ncbi:hypothetical protein HDU98_007903 [Podochytrium sp. JEL0797]|nr:hypothetical protein HDU98_007903 [Podochytrium sp. JEL0797]